MKSYERWNSYPGLILCLSPALTLLKKGFEGSGIIQFYELASGWKEEAIALRTA
jgi:hypothetical protein